MSNWYHQRKSQGLCVSCGRAQNSEGVRCADCVAERYGKYYQLKSQGLCVYCGRARNSDGVRCADCTTKSTARSHYKAGIRKLRNVCMTCGGSRDDSKFKGCSRCRAKANALYHQKRACADSSKCTVCYKPRGDSDYKLCATCRATFRRRYQEKREASLCRRGEASHGRASRGQCLLCRNPLQDLGGHENQRCSSCKPIIDEAQGEGFAEQDEPEGGGEYQNEAEATEAETREPPQAE